MVWAVEVILEQCHLAPAAPEALEEEEEAVEEEASAEASREVSKEAEAEADSVEALVVAVEADSEAAATLAPEAAIEAAIEAATEADLEHLMEPRPALDSIEETEIEASLVVGMSLEAPDAHMMTDLAATEMAAADMAIVTATATVIETVTATVTVVIETVVIETARDVGLVVTWNPLAAEKVGIGKGTMIAHAMTTTGSEDTRVVATKTLESCAAIKLDDWCESTQVSTLGG